jgi:hypothetical protein
MLDRLQLCLSLPTSSSGPKDISRSTRSGGRARRPPFSFLIIVFGVILFVSITLLRAHDVPAELGSGDEVNRADWGEWGDMADIANRFETGFEKGREMLGMGACTGWDPLRDEQGDPAGCLKAKQYRQVQRVLRREEKGAQ